MAEKQHIGLVYGYNPNWIGGTYYIENIIQALKILPATRIPKITLFCLDDTSFDRAKDFEYTFVDRVKIIPKSQHVVVRGINKLARMLFGKEIIVPKYAITLPSVVYPYFSHLDMVSEMVNWIPDFQNRHLPHMFDAADLVRRESEQFRISTSGGKVIFSSENAKSDYEKFYPNHNTTCYVVRFACTMPPYQSLDPNQIFAKYGINKPYFISPNQLWKHKNQTLVLRALNETKKANGALGFTMVFTGKELDDRNIDYVHNLKKLVQSLELQNDVLFLGFIDRKDQLVLMKNALSVIQPSLFEGWSTVVEDAKSMSQHVILSDIPVHREQLSENVTFFNPNNHVELANVITKIYTEGVEKVTLNYEENILRFAEDFIQVFENGNIH